MTRDHRHFVIVNAGSVLQSQFEHLKQFLRQHFKYAIWLPLNCRVATSNWNLSDSETKTKWHQPNILILVLCRRSNMIFMQSVCAVNESFVKVNADADAWNYLHGAEFHLPSLNMPSTIESRQNMKFCKHIYIVTDKTAPILCIIND